MHTAKASSFARVPRLFALLFVSALGVLFQSSLHAQTPLVRINAGGGAVSPFVADTDFSAGNAFSSAATINLSGVTSPAPAAVYQSVRWNASFNYTIPGLTSGTSYLVRLHFVELSFTASGQRKFNVAINGASVLSAFDIFAAVGQNHALVEQFTATANSSGQIVIAFTQGGADNPSVAGIEVDTPAGFSSPYASMYLRGTMSATQWDTSLPMSLVGNDSWQRTSVTLAASTTYQFKFDTGTWTTGQNWGGTGTGSSGTAVVSGGNLNYTSGAAGAYVFAFNDSTLAYSITAPAGLSAPTNVTATSGTTTITLGWTAVSGATSYNVYRSTSSNGEGTTAYATSSSAGYTDSAVTVGTTYYYKVAAVNSTSTSPQSSEVHGAATGSGLAAPTNVSATGGTTSIALSWTAVPGATSYNIYRSTSSNGEGTTAFATSTTNSYTDSAVTIGTTYFYKVAAVNSSSTSPQSFEVSALATGLPAPTGLTASSGTTSIALSWGAVTGATSYNVYRSTSSNGEGSAAYASGSSTTYTDSAVTVGTTYYYKVAAVNSSSTSPQSSEVHGAATGSGLTAPTGVTATSGTTSIALGWTAVTGATSYNIYRSTASNGEGTTAYATSTTAGYTDSAVTVGTTYYYKVAAVNSTSTSPQSSEVHGAATGTPLTAPTNVTATSGTTSIALGWNAVTGATSYNIYRSTSSNGEGTTTYATSSTNSYTDSAVTLGTIYYYKVAAVNSTSTSPQSSEVHGAATGNGTVPPNTPVIQINAGGGAVSPFVADTDFSSGSEFSSTATINVSGVNNAAPAAVYQTVRWNTSFNYTLPGLTSGTSYVVRLHFVELTWTASGKRLFNVAINGTSVLSNFDIFAQVGQNHALEKEFNATANSSGAIVVAFTQGGADNPSVAGIEVWTPMAVPPAPTGLAASGGNGQVSLTWSASTGATSYNLYRGTSSGGEGSNPIASGISGTSYMDTGLVNGTAYYYKVAAANSTGTSPLSNEVSATPLQVPPPAPANLTASANVGNISLSWGSSSGATSYNLYRGTSAGGEGTTAYQSGLSNTSYTDNAVTAGTTYYYVVNAANSAGTSGFSNETSANPLAASAVGATTPFVTYEAEAGSLGGGASVVALTSPPTTEFSSPQLEASGHAFVQLTSTGQSVQWTNNTGMSITAVNIRVCIPDSPGGGGINSTIDLYVNGTLRQAVPVSSTQTWVYETSSTYDGMNQSPSAGNPHVFWDESRTFISGAAVAPGSTIMLKMDSANNAQFYYIDCIDLEAPPAPLTQPANTLSIANYGAVPNNPSFDNASAINNCMSAAQSQGVGVWIPSGTYYCTSGTVLNATNVSIWGAGPWYSTILDTSNSWSNGFFFLAHSASFANLCIDATQPNATPGLFAILAYGDNWTINNVWARHTMLTWADGSNITIENSRVNNSFGDGMNINNVNGTPCNNVLVMNNFARGNGDDGITLNSSDQSGPTMTNCTYKNNTSVASWWANEMGIYGGSNVLVENNLLKDSVKLNGLEVSVFGNGTGGSGDFMLSAVVVGNTVLRGGSFGYGNRNPGIMLGGGSQWTNPVFKDAVLSSNTVINAMFDGIDLFTGSGMVVQYNTITSPGNNGIGVNTGGQQAAGDTTMINNTVTGLNSGYSVLVNPSSLMATISGTPASAYNVENSVQTEACAEGGLDVGFIVNGSYTEYSNVNLNGVSQFTARVASPSGGGTISIHLDSPTGTLIGTCSVPATGAFQTWAASTCSLSGASGTHNIYLVYTAGFNIEWFSFK